MTNNNVGGATTQTQRGSGEAGSQPEPSSKGMGNSFANTATMGAEQNDSPGFHPQGIEPDAGRSLVEVVIPDQGHLTIIHRLAKSNRVSLQEVLDALLNYSVAELERGDMRVNITGRGERRAA